MDDRLVRVRQDLRPAAPVEHLDPVEQIELAIAQPLGQHAHDRALERPRARQAPAHEGARGQLGDELGERLLHRCEQLQQVAEARDGVVGRQELREDVAAADRSGEDDAVLGGGAGQLGERGRRADHLEAAALDDLLDAARDRDRERELAAVAVRAQQAQEEQQRPLERHLVGLLVDQEEPLARAVEDDAEVGADRADQPLRLVERLPQRDDALRAVGGELVRAHRLDPERAEQERQHERGRRAAVVDHEAEAPPANGVHVECREQVLGVALPHARRVGDAADRPERRPAQLVAREVLLHLLLHLRRQLDSRLLAEADLDDLRVAQR